MPEVAPAIRIFIWTWRGRRGFDGKGHFGKAKKVIDEMQGRRKMGKPG